MKNNTPKFLFLLCLLLCLIVPSTCNKLEKKMFVSTGAVSNILINSAAASGNVIDLGDGATQHGHCYATTPNVTVADSTTKLGVPSVGGFISQIKNLVAGKKYYIKAYISKGSVAVYGQEISFTTVSASLPVLTTDSISSITATSASSGGNITSDGGASITARGVCWNKSSGPTIDLLTKTSDGTGTGAFTSSISGLTLGNTYYVRAYATNSAGTAYGNEISFTTVLVIGDSYQGGIVAYILQSGDPGYIAGQTRGLIAAQSDQSAGIAWWNGSYTTTGATGTALGTGNANTNTIVSIQGAGSYAAKLCYDLVLNGYSDWYLPSKDELNELYINRVAIGGFASCCSYWSSSENDESSAWFQLFANGYQYFADKSASNTYVRAVRAFPPAPALPTVTTAAVSSLKSTSAISGGNVTTDGGATVTAYGVCWNTASGPTTSNSKTSDGTGTGAFTSSITGLTLGNTYYVRAYATNSAGTAYGNEISFTTVLAIGDSYQGGIVAYILQWGDPGYIAGQTHGLIAAPSDQSTFIEWDNGANNDITTGATATALGTGMANTNTIVAAQGVGSYAAKLCYDLVLSGYSDWFLPSKDELNELYLNRGAIGGFAGSDSDYWSSSEAGLRYAWWQDFTTGVQFGSGYGSKGNWDYVRAVRAF